MVSCRSHTLAPQVGRPYVPTPTDGPGGGAAGAVSRAATAAARNFSFMIPSQFFRHGAVALRSGVSKILIDMPQGNAQTPASEETSPQQKFRFKAANLISG